jgi:hypothetical protein
VVRRYSEHYNIQTIKQYLAGDRKVRQWSSFPISPLFKDVVRLQAFSGITYTPTPIVSYGGPIGYQYWLAHYDVDKDRKLRSFTPHDELDNWMSTQFFREDQYVFPLHATQLMKMIDAGGRVGFGSRGRDAERDLAAEPAGSVAVVVAPRAALDAATPNANP